jgi:hypothetical protein
VAFFFQFCAVAQVKNQPYEYLGKFGDIQNIEKPFHAVGSCGKIWRFKKNL